MSNTIETAYERQQLCDKLEPLLNYDEECNSALILINVWHTRHISAHYGYNISQEILALIADELQAFVKPDCCLIRTAHHEFALLIQNISNVGHCQLALNKIIRELDNQSFTISDYTSKTKVTAAAALYPTHAISIEQLVQYAEVAINVCEKEKVPSLVYSEKIANRIVRKLQIEAELETAIQSKNLELWYQPKINLANGSLYGVEALVRWNSSLEGYISPEIFIPLAEQRNFIQDLTQWVINTAFRTQVAWKEMGLDISMAVNISGKVIDGDDFVENVEHSRGIWNVDRKRITLEVTETSMMESMETSLKKLKHLKKQGYQISIDDFGTGYSSLEYFKFLPVHEIKIDKSFVANMTEDKNDYSIVKMVVGLSDSFGLEMVAEGIEDQKTLDALKDLGVQRAQGYFIAKPMPEEEFLTWAEFYLTNL